MALVSFDVLFPNLSATGMAPVGHVAATAAAIPGTLSTVVGTVGRRRYRLRL